MRRAIEKPIRAVDRARAGPPPHCPRCGYSLHRAVSPRCPECGIPVARFIEVRELRAAARRMLKAERAAWRAAAAGRLGQVADFVVAGTVLAAAGLMVFAQWRTPILSMLLIPLLTLAVPAAYVQWSNGLSFRAVWLLVAVVWWGALALAAAVNSCWYGCIWGLSAN
jgi:hypothetical protein